MSPRVRFLPSLALATGAFALGAWLFHGRAFAPSNSAAATSALSPTTSTAPSPAHRSGPLAFADPQRELLLTLRAKLPASLDELLRTIAEIGKTHPALAIDLAHELGRTDREKAAWVTNAMQQWADREPAAAWQWLRQLTSDRMQELAGGELGSVVLGAMATRDPNLVVAQLDSLLRHGNDSQSISTPVAVHLGLAALTEHGKLEVAKSVVEAWAKDSRNLPLEAAAFETVAIALAQTHPRESGEWLRALPATDERNAAFATFVAAWAERDPRAALQWAETLPAESGRHAAIQRTVSDWIEGHAEPVSAWLGDYLTRAPAGPATDSLIETVINVSPTLRSAPQAALQWTNLLSDPVKRVDYHEKIALRWSEHDAAAALAFVAASSLLPPERKAVLVQKIHSTQSTPKSGG